MISFEEHAELIEKEIYRMQGSYTLKALPYLSFDDFASETLTHIWEKWGQYDESKPLLPWVRRIINTQFINHLRNNLGRLSKPCIRCPFRVDEGCSYTKSGLQDVTCKLYARWIDSKGEARFNINLPVSVENHQQEVFSMPADEFDYMGAKAKFEVRLKTVLSRFEWKLYKLLYIKCKSEAEVTKILKLKPEKSRKGSNKVVRDTNRIIIEKSKILLAQKDMDL